MATDESWCFIKVGKIFLSFVVGTLSIDVPFEIYVCFSFTKYLFSKWCIILFEIFEVALCISP